MFEQILNIHPTIRKIIIIAGSALLMLGAAYCTFGALVSAFELQANIRGLLWFWLLCSFAVSALAMLYRWKGIFAFAISTAAMMLWRITEIIDGAKWVIHSITKYYSKWIDVTALYPEAQEFAEEPTVFFAAAGVAVIILLSIAICLRRSTFLTILCTAPIVFLTFVITTLQADLIYLLGLVVIYMTMLISSAIGPDDFVKRALAFVPSFVLAVMFIVTAYILTPPERYEREAHIVTIGNHIRTIMTGLRNLGQLEPDGINRGIGWPVGLPGGIWMFNTENVNIADAGRRVITGQSLLEVTATDSGTFYLRGFALEHFDGRSWQSARRRSIWQESLVYYESDDELARELPAIIAQMSNYWRDIAGMVANDRAEDPDSWPGFPDIPDVNAIPLIGMNINRIGDITNINYFPHYTVLTLEPENLPREERSLRPYDVNFFYFRETVHSIADAVLNGPNYFVVGEWSGRGRAEIEFYFLSRNRVHFNELINSELINSVLNWFDEDDITINTITPGERLFDYADFMKATGINTQVDENTAQGLRQLAIEAGIDPSAERAEIVDAVGRYIRSAAAYTLTPEPIPAGEDFALYFLQTLKEGYCIHFATAAVLMLRSLDIPARFTSGYVARVPPGSENSPVTLTDGNAHAWVEVFYEDLGWLYLEATPPSAAAGIPPARQHAPERVEETPAPESEEPGRDIETPEPDPNGESNQQTPGAGTDIQQATRRFPEWLQSGIVYVVCFLICVSALHLRRRLTLKHRARRFEQADTNAAIIYIWRYIIRLGRREIVPPTDIEELALKARFSRHRISEEERRKMVKYARRLADEIYRTKDGVGQVWLKYFRAVC